MSSESFLPRARLSGPDGFEVARANFVGQESFTATLPTSGLYWIEASNSSLTPYQYGAYRLTLVDLAKDLVFADDFESGDLSRWASASTKGGKLSARAAANHAGAFGLDFDVSNLPPPASKAKLWVKDTSPEAEARYRARFYLNLNDLTVPTASRTLRLMTARTASDPAARPFELRLVYEDGTWRVVGVARDNSGTITKKTVGISIPRSWVQVVVDWKAASGPWAGDGYLVVSADGAVALVDGLANDQVRIDGVQLGFLGGPGLGSTGRAFVDDFESRREGPFSSPYGRVESAFVAGAGGGRWRSEVQRALQPSGRVDGDIGVIDRSPLAGSIDRESGSQLKKVRGGCRPSCSALGSMPWHAGCCAEFQPCFRPARKTLDECRSRLTWVERR